MVVIFLPAACATVVWHERTARPSRCTVHAPHCATPQPNFVPVSWSRSRITHRSGVPGSTSTVWDLPLINNVAMTPPARWRKGSYLVAGSLPRNSPVGAGPAGGRAGAGGPRGLGQAGVPAGDRGAPRPSPPAPPRPAAQPPP